MDDLRWILAIIGAVVVVATYLSGRFEREEWRRDREQSFEQPQPVNSERIEPQIEDIPKAQKELVQNGGGLARVLPAITIGVAKAGPAIIAHNNIIAKPMCQKARLFRPSFTPIFNSTARAGSGTSLCD